jgi:hypothetical protein
VAVPLASQRLKWDAAGADRLYATGQISQLGG